MVVVATAFHSSGPAYAGSCYVQAGLQGPYDNLGPLKSFNCNTSGSETLRFSNYQVNTPYYAEGTMDINGPQYGYVSSGNFYIYTQKVNNLFPGFNKLTSTPTPRSNYYPQGNSNTNINSGGSTNPTGSYTGGSRGGRGPIAQ